MDRSPGHASALSHALLRYVEARSAAMNKARQDLKVSELDARALLYIGRHPGTRPGHLREYLSITSAGVTALVDRLVERGTVRREVDPEDRRVSRLTATVDLTIHPWSALTRFDDAFAAAAADSDPSGTTMLAGVLQELTDSAAEAAA